MTTGAESDDSESRPPLRFGVRGASPRRAALRTPVRGLAAAGRAAFLGALRRLSKKDDSEKDDPPTLSEVLRDVLEHHLAFAFVEPSAGVRPVVWLRFSPGLLISPDRAVVRALDNRGLAESLEAVTELIKLACLAERLNEPLSIACACGQACDNQSEYVGTLAVHHGRRAW